MTDITEMNTAEASPRRRISIKKMLAFMHLWIGIICALPFIALGLTGSILMIGHDIPSLSSDAQTPPALPTPIGEMLAIAQNAAPPGATLNAIMAPEYAGEPIVARFNAPRRDLQQGPPLGQRGPTVKIDPATGVATLSAPQMPVVNGGAFNFMRVMHDLHGRLLIDGGLGRQLVGWLGVFMCFIGFSGIVMWWPRGTTWAAWKAALSFRFGKSALKTNRDMHGAVGFWGLAVFMIVSLSGVYLGFPQQIATYLNAAPMVRDQRGTNLPKVQPVEGDTPLTVDEAVIAAQLAAPETTLWSVIFPPRPDTPIRVNLTRVIDGKPVRIAVYVDQHAKRVIEVRDPSTLKGMDKVLISQRGLHVGTGYGLVWWVLVFLSGFLPLLFVVTGITMWWLKRRNKKRIRAA